MVNFVFFLAWTIWYGSSKQQLSRDDCLGHRSKAPYEEKLTFILTLYKHSVSLMMQKETLILFLAAHLSICILHALIENDYNLAYTCC